jgi:hypothetical protein
MMTKDVSSDSKISLRTRKQFHITPMNIALWGCAIPRLMKTSYIICARWLVKVSSGTCRIEHSQ